MQGRYGMLRHLREKVDQYGCSILFYQEITISDSLNYFTTQVNYLMKFY